MSEREQQLEGEVARLQQILTGIVEDYEYEARECEDSYDRDEWEEKAERLRKKLEKNEVGAEILQRVAEVDQRIDQANRKAMNASQDFFVYKRDMEKVEVFSRWLATRFPGLFNLEYIATGYRVREKKIEERLRELLTRLTSTPAVAYPVQRSLDLTQTVLKNIDDPLALSELLPGFKDELGILMGSLTREATRKEQPWWFSVEQAQKALDMPAGPTLEEPLVVDTNDTIKENEIVSEKEEGSSGWESGTADATD